MIDITDDKWADYLISAVRYDAEHTHIDKVKAHEDKGGKITPSYEEDRETVVANINRGKTYCTILKKEGKWHKGEIVGIIVVNNREFIRTDKNKTESDNLGELPEF